MQATAHVIEERPATMAKTLGASTEYISSRRLEALQDAIIFGYVCADD
jgi:hypothetical protein